MFKVLKKLFIKETLVWQFCCWFSWLLRIKVFFLKYLNFQFIISLGFYIHQFILYAKRNCLQKPDKPIKIVIILENHFGLIVEKWSLQFGLSWSSLYIRSLIVQLSLCRCNKESKHSFPNWVLKLQSNKIFQDCKIKLKIYKLSKQWRSFW